MSCKKERGDILKNFLSSEEIKELTHLSEEELELISFGNESSDDLIEAIKKMIFSYCNEDSETLVIRNINSIIYRQGK